ncbi:MAG: T9SS type A sorting domain-containing protein [Chitinivibrionales bacterium]|nr:T9SS type A sorting domain-containing protein [Chitinivibrionales bacterium]
MQQGIDRMIHLTWGGRHADYVRHVVLDPDLLVGEEATNIYDKTGHQDKTRRYLSRSHSLAGIQLPEKLKKTSSVTVRLFDMSGKSAYTISRILKAGAKDIPFNPSLFSGVYHVRITVDGLPLSSYRLMLQF